MRNVHTIRTVQPSTRENGLAVVQNSVKTSEHNPVENTEMRGADDGFVLPCRIGHFR